MLLEVESGEEYLIPYGARPLWTGLENGKLYTVAEVYEVLSETYHSNGYSIGGSGDNGGGGTARVFDPASDFGNGLMILFSGALIAAVAGGLVFVWQKCRKRI